MNIERFILARKTSGLSQNELAEGICTQATLSRFENNGHVPNLKILIQLCNRLNLPLGELFPKVGVKHSETIEKMNQAAQDLVGTQDFTSFVASGSQAKSNVRTIYEAQVYYEEHDHEIIFEFVGNGFLYNQVRIMVALLLEIGSGQRPVDDIPRVIAAKDRQEARMTAPASGLYLVNVDYGSNSME